MFVWGKDHIRHIGELLVLGVQDTAQLSILIMNYVKQNKVKFL